MSAFPHTVDLHTASWKVVVTGIKYPWRPIKCASCKVFCHAECNKDKVTVNGPDKVSVIALPAVPNKVWVVKGTKGDGASSSVPVEPALVVQNSPIPVDGMPCVNQFTALQ